MITNCSGVYCLRNKINNKIYIGSTKNIRSRYYKHRSNFNLKHNARNAIMDKVYRKYNFSDFEFQVLLTTDDYLLWEDLLIKLLNPEYNTSSMIDGKLQPNLGKKFDKNWIKKITSSSKHSKSTRKHLSKLNKQNACKVKFQKEDTVLTFNSWREAGCYFDIKSKNSASSYFTKTKKSNDRFSWKGWNITRVTRQKKEVLFTEGVSKIYFSSSYEVDKHLGLWRGATSNAIKNNNGVLHQYRVEYA